LHRKLRPISKKQSVCSGFLATRLGILGPLPGTGEALANNLKSKAIKEKKMGLFDFARNIGNKLFGNEDEAPQKIKEHIEFYSSF
jgi:hypothetical protein